MKDFIYYKTRMVRDFKKIVNSGVQVNKYRVQMVSFLNYMSTDFDGKLKTLTNITADNIVLESVIDTRYRSLFKGVELREITKFLEDTVKRINEFKGKESNLRVLVAFYFLYFVVVSKLVEFYMSTLNSYNTNNSNNRVYNLDDMGITNNILKYYILFPKIREKTIDDWIKTDIDEYEDTYISSAIKRILIVFSGNASDDGAVK